MARKSKSSFKTIATIITTTFLTLSVATGAVFAHALRSNKLAVNGDSSGLSIGGTKGDPGKDGRSVVKIEKTNTYGLVDEYTITYSDDTTSTFVVTNGANGEQGIQGFPGVDGHTPVIVINENGNWSIDGVDSGVKAQGPKGDKGDDGVSVVSIEKTNTYGLVDEYTITYSNGTTSIFTVTNGANGEQGIQGYPGTDGRTPVISIGASGNWIVDGVDTGVKAQGPAGQDGRSILTITKTYSDGLLDTYTIYYSDGTTSEFVVTNGANGSIGAQGLPGENGHTPVITIGENGNWFVDGVDTGTKAQGPQGQPGAAGQNGETPYIGANGNWWIGETDTGVKAEGTAGQNGETPFIGENGNWWIGTTDTGVKAEGTTGQPGVNGASITTGNGEPDQAYGNNSDSYIDLNTWNYYVKENGEWILKGNIRGGQGQNGADGRGIASIVKTSSEGLVDTYTITYTDGTSSTFVVVNGANGQNGQNGQDGHSPVITINGDGNWEIDGVDTGVKAQGATGATGATGNGISSIVYLGTEGLISTYRIIFTDGSSFMYTVTNGADGQNGQDGADGTCMRTGEGAPNASLGQDGDSYIDTLTWDYYVKNGGTWTLKGNIKGETGNTGSQGEQGQAGQDGVSVVSVIKTSTNGLIDTYTITYSNGASSTFTVTNGANGATGAAGQDGNTLLVGLGAPTEGTGGQDGDSYIDVTTWTYYLKTSGSWVSQGTFKGADGQNGASITVTSVNKETLGLVDTYTITFSDGTEMSFTVTNGVNGTNGTNGTAVVTGAGVPDNANGVNGDSYIDLTTWNFFVKENGVWVLKGNIKGETGAAGQNGADGVTPYIGVNGNWWIGQTDTGVKAEGTTGTSGQNGETPYIGANGNWWVGETDTGVKAQGEAGETPFIGENGNWWVGSTDTGVKAQGATGAAGQDGITPHIGDNGNWWIGTTDTGVKAQGADGATGADGISITGITVVDDTDPSKVIYRITFSNGDHFDYTVKNGANGTNGNTVTTGNGVPSNDEGTNGDSYINLENWDYYVKEGNSWVLKGNIKGAQGEQGYSILVGSTDPNDADGRNGDSYINTTNGDYWFKENDAWTKVGNIKGQQGEQGEAGSSVRTGEGTPDNADGANGDSYLDLNSWNYYVKENDEWILKGNIHNSPDKYTVTYDVNGGSSAPDSQEVYAGQKADKPVTDPTKDGYFFQGWYTADGNKWNFEKDIVTGPITLVAHWAQFKVIDGVLVGCSVESGDVIIPASFDGQTITAIGRNVFGDNKANITSVTIPNTVVTINDSAFEGCTGLTSIVLPRSLTRIGDKAFKGCSNVAYIYMQEGLEAIGESAFEGCTNIKTLIIPNSVKAIGKGAFDSSCDLESLTIPFIGGTNTMTRATNDKFLGYIFGASSSDENATYVPASIKTIVITSDAPIYSNALKGVASVRNIVIQGSPSFIGKGAFAGCTELRNLTLPYIGATSDLSAYSYGSIDPTNETEGTVYFNKNTNTIWIKEEGRWQVMNDASADAIASGAMPSGDTLPATANAGDTFFEYTTGDIYLSIFGNDEWIKYANICDSTANVSYFGYVFGADNYTGQDSSLPAHLETVILTGANGVNKDIIPANAFNDCKTIKTIVLPNSVREIQERAFDDCRALEAIDLPDSLEVIGKFAFYNCSELKTIVILNNVTYIGEGAFVLCSNLESATVPFIGSSVDDLSTTFAHIFQHDNKLKTVIVTGGNGEHRDTISPNAFKDLQHIETIILPEGIKTISEDAFYNCSSLKYVGLPSTLESIEAEAFSHCESLTYIVLPNSLTSIGSRAFAISGLKHVIVPGSVLTIGYKAFGECAGLESFTMEEGGVNKTLGDFIFDSDTALKSVIISNNVVSIGDYSFRNCSGLEYVYIGNGITEVSWYMFKDCSSLKTIYLPETVTSIGKEAFKGCTSLTTFTISNNVTEICNSAFESSGLTAVIIPSSVTSIGDGAFRDCASLESVYMEEGSAITVGKNVFYDDVNLKTVIIKSNLSSIDTQSFSGCTALEYVTLGEGLTEIKASMFSGCTSLKTIIIPDTVTSIGEQAFQGCSSLETIVIPNGVTAINKNTFDGCSSLANVYIPDSVLIISEYAFKGCSSLTSIIIPNTVTELGKGVFAGCTNLESVTTPFVGGTSNEILATVLKGEGAPSDSTGSDNQLYVDTSTAKVYLKISGKWYYRLTLGDSIAVNSPNPGGTPATDYYVKSTNGQLWQKNGTSWFKMDEKLQDVIGYFGYNFISDDNAIQIDTFNDVIPSTLTNITITGDASIGAGAFRNCTNLKVVVVSGNPTTIGKSAFAGCTNIESMSLTYVGGSTTNDKYLGYVFGASNFSYNSTYVPESLKTVIVTGNTSYNGSDFLYDCQHIENVFIMGNGAISTRSLYNCNSMKTLTLSKLNTSLKDLFGYGSNPMPESLKAVTLLHGSGANGDEIAASTFADCAYLETIVLPDNIRIINDNAFSGCKALKNINVPEYLVSIGEGAFTNCKSLESFVVPDTVTTFGSFVFSGCSNLKYAKLGKNITVIGFNTFYGCTQLRYVDFGDITEIGNSAFSRCENLTNIVLPNSLTKIENNAFNYCYSLNSVILPGANSGTQNNIISIGEYAFANCRSLTYINLEDCENITTINPYTFQNCYSLSSITLPVNLTSVANGAFMDCHSLKYVYIYAYLKTIGNSAFQNCESLATINLNRVETIEGSAFYNCKGLTYVTFDNNYLKTIEYSAFSGCISLQAIVIPDSVTSIGSNAFSNCNSLTSFTTPFIGSTKDDTSRTLSGLIGNGSYSVKTVVVTKATAIPNNCFASCTNLVSVTISGGCTSIGSCAFGSCKNLQFVNLPSSVTSLGDNAFQYCDSLITISLPYNLETIGRECFYQCISLQSITIPNKVTTIDYSAFRQCTALTSVKCGNKLETIGGYAFEGCASLRYMQLNDGLLTIGDYAFQNCAIESIVIPGTVELIDSYAFETCKKLTYVFFEDGVKEIGYNAFYGCVALKEVVIPNSVTAMGYGAFSGCNSLESITLPFVGEKKNPSDYDGINFGYIFGTSNSSGQGTYVPASLKTVVITGDSTIGYMAFAECSNIETIVVTNSRSNIAAGAFAECTSLKNLTLPYIGASASFGNILTGTENPDGYVWVTTPIGNIKTDPSSTTVIYETYTGDPSELPIGTIVFSIEYNDVAIITENGFENYSGDIGYAVPTIGSNGNWWIGTTDTGVKGPNNSYLTLGHGDPTSNGEYCDYESVYIDLDTFDVYVGQTIGSDGDIYVDTNSNQIYRKYNGVWHLENAYAGDMLTGTGNPDDSNGDDGDHYIDCSDGSVYYKRNGSWEYLEKINDHFSRLGYYFSIFTNLHGIPDTLANITITGDIDIVEGAFAYAHGLETITFEGDVTSIGDNAFRECHSLTSFVVPSTVTSIGTSAFEGCYSLKYIDLANVQVIGNYAFKGCTGLTNVVVPDSVTSIGLGAFQGGRGWENQGNPGITLGDVDPNDADGNDGDGYVNYVTGDFFEKDGGTWTVNSTLPTDMFGSGAPAPDLTTSTDMYIDIDTGVLYHASNSVSNLESITLPFIGGSATASDVQFLAYIFGATDYNDSNFIPRSLKTVVITSGNGANKDAIPEGAFYDCRNIKNFVLPEGVRYVNGYAFYDCEGLQTITLDGIETIGDNAFSNCGNLQIVHLVAHSSEISIGDYAFSGCEVLSYIDTNNITSIGKYAFLSCSGLQTFSFSTGIKNIDEGAFVYCTGLQYVEFQKVTDPTATKNPVAIGKNAFRYCYALRTVNFSNANIVSIGEEAFRECFSLESITIPETVTSVDYWAFLNCTGLKEVTVLSENAVFVNGRTFDGCDAIEKMTITFTGYEANGSSAAVELYRLFGSNVNDMPKTLKTIVITGGNGADRDTIVAGAFKDCKNIEHVVIGEGIKAIESGAFEGCSRLKIVELPSTLTTISNGAFKSCNWLTTVYYNGTQTEWNAITIGSDNDKLTSADIKTF